jgi:hypothetical protein
MQTPEEVIRPAVGLGILAFQWCLPILPFAIVLYVVIRLATRRPKPKRR